MNKFKLAQKRNYFKFVISGLPKPIDKNALSREEKIKWYQLLELRKSLIDSFENNSRRLGLNVPEIRCLYSDCRNKANKYLSKHDHSPICKKHKIMEDECK